MTAFPFVLAAILVLVVAAALARSALRLQPVGQHRLAPGRHTFRRQAPAPIRAPLRHRRAR